MNAQDLIRAVTEAEPAELPALVGMLAQAQALAFARLATCQSGPDQRAETALSPEAIAGRLDLAPSKVYHLLRTGHLRGAKLGKYWRVTPADLTAYLRQRTR